MTKLKFRCLSLTGDWAYGNIDMQEGMLEISQKDKEMLYQSSMMSKTMGQFTGLKDKNDKEIYEGDILKLIDKAGKENIMVVVWSPYFLRFDLQKSLHNCKGSKKITYWDRENREVIGNIFENRELLNN